MYRCEITGKLSRQGDPRTGEWAHVADIEKFDTKGSEKLNKIVVETRERTYTKWVRNEETNKWEEVFVAKGWEIVKEISASDEGVALWQSWTDEEKTVFLKSL
jgi:hypothetical protein